MTVRSKSYSCHGFFFSTRQPFPWDSAPVMWPSNTSSAKDMYAMPTFASEFLLPAVLGQLLTDKLKRSKLHIHPAFLSRHPSLKAMYPYVLMICCVIRDREYK